MQLGDQIKQLRKDKKLNQQDLADVIGVTKASVSDYERNKRVPKPEILKIIAETLDVPFSSLYSCIENKEDDEYVPMEYPAGSDYARLMPKLLAAFNKLSDEARTIAIDRIEELCMIPKYQRTLTNVLKHYISKRYRLSYELLHDTGLQDLPRNNKQSESWKLQFKIQSIILQREINSTTKKIWEFLYCSFDDTFDIGFDIRQVFDSMKPQYKSTDNLGFVFDDESIFYKFYNYYSQQNELTSPDEKAQGANIQALFVYIEKDTMEIQDVIEYDSNR